MLNHSVLPAAASLYNIRTHSAQQIAAERTVIRVQRHAKLGVDQITHGVPTAEEATEHLETVNEG